MTYKTITNGYDWGPAIDKIILDLEQTIDSKEMNSQDFIVGVKQTFKGKIINHSQRTVLKAYLSDASGNETGISRYIALDLEVGPTLSNGSPLIYNRENGRNEYIESIYEISLPTFLQLNQDDRVIKEHKGDLNPLCDLFVHNQPYEHNGVSLSYAYYKPIKEGLDMALIIWLHGAGEGGQDTTIPVLANKVTNLITPEIQSYFGDSGAYVLVPQSPAMWMDFNGENVYNIMVNDSDGYSYYTKALKGLIDEFIERHPDIDHSRLYIGGCSNGGYMTIKMIMDYPDFFAAAFPTCAAYASKWLTQDRLDSIKDTPIWLIHAQNDPVVKISEPDENGNFKPLDDFSNAIYHRLLDAGNPNVYYTRYDKVFDPSGKYLDSNKKPHEYHGHWSWIYTLDNACSQVIDGKKVSLFQWLAKQSKL